MRGISQMGGGRDPGEFVTFEVTVYIRTTLRDLRVQKTSIYLS